MAKDLLPDQVNPLKAAESALQYKGALPLANMARLKESLHSDQGQANVTLRFGIDDQGVKFIRGNLNTQLILQCQRCMESFTYEIMADFVYGIVGSEEEAQALPANFDPIIVKDSELSIPEMVEEEIIVNLPIVSMHAREDCKVKLPVTVIDDPEAKGITNNVSPFKVIESLKNKLKDSEKGP